ncbi:3-deoxy-7-phosphoheptulonate synthase AroG [Cocleimonas flava]|jgi:3-deoxy-7-phosphoheptulonate synthase|uniref:Phospho-2-dehydro-3-deoxyheptonate aldolase n=1 Tax=Cocleimonas flava TaxID=634765 RepID=A0A4R1EZ30_9GAMM|nr:MULTISPECIES: 3-deoxy-7-phosphoheptulonate synthase [Cocleimonas]MEB8432014.1 3-deoxy-7-phosphoheptulonate synthase [Cocleimonas sp. KMM 6892]MEC4714900.1 3-deoxy-7-phosphoheptulonate synthase [Cocleimonas sp. KMM 6895]MEC4744286.1 3-deoxy-7-phosphoheptulonate synthase [Cocleimonas sp. KMM 6896]TCJ87127.1 3-deoxy-D-arabinoheptulosonate-7-phosphate synthase [Cocleimonas flava]
MSTETKYQTDDLRIMGETEVHSPATLLEDYPLSDKAAETVFTARNMTHDILHDKDDRVLVVVGPCSIHDPKAALEYAARLAKMREELSDDLHIVMRVYFEKPRTSVGWKGLINDPDLTGKFNINKGLRVARSLLKDLAEQGMPTATEYLDLISPQYVADLISWGAIGARTTESQGHRELASGMSCPIGFKNGTYGNLDIAINAIKSASHSHHFMSLTKAGHSAIFTTKGNDDCHIILRGGRRPNYDEVSVSEALGQLEKAGLSKKLMVDFSHANSNKDFNNQPKVAHNIAGQIARGEHGICGVMIESHLVEGNQNGEGKNLDDLTYGQSITDACINWDTTEAVLRELAEAVAKRRSLSQ